MEWYKQSRTCVILINEQFSWKDWLVECVVTHKNVGILEQLHIFPKWDSWKC